MKTGIWLNRIKTAENILLALLFLILLFSCSGSDSNRVSLGDGHAGGIGIPQPVQRFVSSDGGVLSALISIDGGGQHSMSITGNEAQYEFKGLTPGTHVFTITFEFPHTIYGNYVLANAETSLTLVVGENSLVFNESDYLYPDDDEDGITNLAELEADTDPGNPDTVAPSSVASPGSRFFRYALDVTLTCSDADSGCAEIYYTTDNTEPTKTSTPYGGGPVTLSATTPLKFIAVDNAGNKEGVNTVEYTHVPDLGVFDRIVDLGATGNTIRPFRSSSAYEKIQLLYFADDIAGSGYVKNIAFQYAGAVSPAVQCPLVSVRMGHVDLTTLSDTFENNIDQGKGSLTTVIDNRDLIIPAGSSNDYGELELDVPFYYNGEDNIVIEVERFAACDDSVAFVTANTGTETFLYSNLQSPTGFLSTIVHGIQFGFEGGDANLVKTAELNSYNGIPLGHANNKIQLLYYASEISGSGPITGIGFPVSVDFTSLPTPEESYTVNLKLGHSTKSDLDLEWATNYADTPMTVSDAVSLVAPGELPDITYMWIPIPDNVFVYNGSDNLIVEIEVPESSGDTYWKVVQNTGNQRRAYGTIENTSASNTDTRLYGLKLRFAGGDAAVITDGIDSESVMFASSLTRVQYLFRAAELGAGGYIDSLAFRMDTSSSLSTLYNDCRIVLGHTAASIGSLAPASFSSNLTDAQEVYNGNITIPALSAGDWFEIPLTTVFQYDRERNLVSEVSCGTGAGLRELVRTNTDGATRYPDRYLYHTSSNTQDVPEGTGNYMIDVRVGLK